MTATPTSAFFPLRKRRFLITLSSTRSRHYLSQRWHYAPTLAEAERKACNLLRAQRLTSSEGSIWDRWTVATASPHTGLPKIQSYGSHNGTTISARDHGWKD